MMRLALYLLAFPVILGVSADKDLDWPIGKWQTVEKNGQYSEEKWVDSENGGFRGEGILVEDMDTLFQERMSLVRQDGSWFFRAELEKQAPVYFSLEEQSDVHWVFINGSHDYPQRIEYRLVSEDQLNASVSLLDGQNPNHWEYFKKP